MRKNNKGKERFWPKQAKNLKSFSLLKAAATHFILSEISFTMS